MNEVIKKTEKIFSNIKQDFNSLWKYKLRGDTLEIITPFTTLAGSFISVFLTQREDRFIVSDGHRLIDNINDNNFGTNKRTVYFQEIASHYDVKRTETDFFFKSTRDMNLLSSYIYDIVFFQNAVFDNIYADDVFFSSEAQDHWFSTKVNDLLAKKIDENKKYNRVFRVQKKHQLIKNFGFNTVLEYQGCPTIWAAMYISGSTPGIYADHICRATAGFMYVRSVDELAKNIKLAAIFDDYAKGNSQQHNRIISVRQLLNNSFKFSHYTYQQIESINDLSVLYQSA